MAKTNPQSNKRRKEMDRKLKREEKRQKKLDKKAAAHEDVDETIPGENDITI